MDGIDPKPGPEIGALFFSIKHSRKGLCLIMMLELRSGTQFANGLIQACGSLDWSVTSCGRADDLACS